MYFFFSKNNVKAGFGKIFCRELRIWYFVGWQISRNAKKAPDFSLERIFLVTVHFRNNVTYKSPRNSAKSLSGEFSEPWRVFNNRSGASEGYLFRSGVATGFFSGPAPWSSWRGIEKESHVGDSRRGPRWSVFMTSACGGISQLRKAAGLNLPARVLRFFAREQRENQKKREPIFLTLDKNKLKVERFTVSNKQKYKQLAVLASVRLFIFINNFD